MSDRINRGEPTPSAEWTEEQSGPIGQSVKRVDAFNKVTGKTEYTMDMYPDDVLYAKLLTSDYAHAYIEKIDTSQAKQASGVAAVVTATEAPDTLKGKFIRDEPIFAKNKVRYVGEPIAIVAAETEEEAEQAIGLIDVSYNPQKAVDNLQEAYKFDPPAVVHENLREYETGEDGFHVDGDDSKRPNLLTTAERKTGNMEKQLERADIIVEDEYQIEPLQHCTMEPHVAVAQNKDSETTIWTSHQIPHVIKKHLIRTFQNINENNINIKAPYAGGAFGSRERPVVEPRVLSVAQYTDRPVRLAHSRRQQFTTSPGRPEVHVKLKDAVTDDGDLLARDAIVNLNAGAYDHRAFLITQALPFSTLGSYNVPAVHQQCNAIYTNEPPYGAYRGFGHPEVNFAAERHMDKVAETLGIDPVEYRVNNLPEASGENNFGQSLHQSDFEEVLTAPINRLKKVEIKSQYPEYDTEEWKIGIGHAYGSKSVPHGETEVQVDLHTSGEITARVGAPDVGQGANTAVSQMVAEEFSTTIENVQIIAGDTNKTKRDMQGPSGSRFTAYTGNAIKNAAEKVKAEVCQLAVDVFQIEDTFESIRIGNAEVTHEPTGESAPLSKISDYAAKTNADTYKEGTFSAVGAYSSDETIYWVPVAQAVAVACNTITGKTEVLHIVSAADVGTAINPKTVEQQLEGGAGMGIAGSLYEKIVYNDGRVVNDSFKTYRVPKPTELPCNSETIVYESYDPEGPYGAKSVGEVGVFPTGAAVADAVSDAIDCDFNVQPITPDKIIEALTERSETP